MLQYLLNTSAIWLISLIAFDAFLRRESYHGYNRFYLLFTFLLGALLPLTQLQQAVGRYYPETLGSPLQTVIAAKQAIINAPVTGNNTNWQLWLLVVYLSGIAVMALLTCVEIVKLSAFFRNGQKSREGRWTIIETGKEHAPFSFRNTLFVCTRSQYNNEEWNMILMHEANHTRLLHIADLLLMQTARIFFWFHPLVYIYNRRLLLVDEYQADGSSKQHPQVYGKFLVEQALLQSAPALSHSFNRSPIKKRILMLTRTSSTAAKTKTLVFIPLLMVCMLCFSKNIFSQSKPVKHGVVAKFPNIDTSTRIIKSYDDILADPRIICSVPGAHVTSFSVSFQPKGKDYIGPYAVAKGDKLSSNPLIIETLNKLKESGIEKTTFFVEEIHATYKGGDIALSPIILRIIPDTH